ncbi:hypothetical protein PG997_001630 [Apiospora hydei]|uniref:Rhodopsin domain-containing protein n=1 Tax=Apiospora hydei TaxID=1337664 RepID=A0ABR1XE25_9PEZI
MAAATVPDPEGPVVLENMQPIVWIVTIPFAILCLSSILIRLYTRRYIAKSFGADDWFMLAVLPVWIGQQYIAWMWTILGGGLHQGVVPAENVELINVYLFAEEFYYLFLQFLIKMSFLCFYLRTLTTTNRFQHAVYVVMGLVCFQTVGTWIFYGLQCIPIDAYFHPELYPNRRCIDSSLSYYLPSVALPDADITCDTRPPERHHGPHNLHPAHRPLWHLQVSLKRRLGLIAIFTMGGGAITVSLLRFIVLWQLSNTADTTYVFGSVTIVTSVEFAAAVITANMPGTAGFYKYFRARRERQSRGYGGSGESGGGGVGHRHRGSGGGEDGAQELETIGAKSSRKKKVQALNSVLESRSDNDGPRRTESEEKLTEYHQGMAF